MPRFFRIHPAVGIARMGNSPTEHFIGPEQPGLAPNVDPATGRFLKFKDAQGRIKRQAARFRIWEYEQRDGRLFPKQEVNLKTAGIVSIQWSVHLANRKAAFFKFNGQNGANGTWTTGLRNPTITDPAQRELKLAIDPGAKTISGANHVGVAFLNAKTHIPIKSLGELKTDADGRLVVLGGQGESNTTAGMIIANYANNDTWFDDASDGPVTATVEVKNPDGTVSKVAADGAWVMVGPPDFAPGAGNIVRLLDTMWDVAVRFLPLSPEKALFNQGQYADLKSQKDDWNESTKSFTTYRPSYMREVLPLLQRAMRARDVHNPEATKSFHASFLDWDAELGTIASEEGQELRASIFKKMRDPSGTVIDPKQMPKGLGDDYFTDKPTQFFSVTPVQYAILKQWAAGKFREDYTPTPPPPSTTLTPDGLDVAALEHSVGGPFFPGIDVSWMIRNKGVYSEPFRIRHGVQLSPQFTVRPGAFSQQMALPWQADFYECQKEVYTKAAEGMYHMWWSTHRPDDVRVKGATGMVPWARRLMAVAKLQEAKPEVGKLPTHDPEADSNRERREQFKQMQKNWWTLGFVVTEGTSAFEAEASEPAP